VGDRANVAVKQGDEDKYVYLYSHWGGHELPLDLQAALKRNQRWDDYQYLARIIFQQMIGEDKGETGYGISASLCDNERPILVVDCEKQQVRVEPQSKHESSRPSSQRRNVPGGTFSFTKFVNLKLDPEKPWAKLHKEYEE